MVKVSRRALRALCQPLPLGAIALLVVNDHLLKGQFGGTVTGKLSDLAGLVFFPLLLAAFLGPILVRPSLTIGMSVAATGLWFSAINLSP